MRPPFIIDQQGKISPDDGPIGSYIRTKKGRRTLAASMAAPIRRNLNYHAIARKALAIQQLSPGALPCYDRDIDVSAVVIGTKFKHDHLVINNCGKLTGKGQYISARRVVVPTFEIFSNPTINISDITTRRFSLIDRYGGKPKLPGKFKHNVFEIGNNGKLSAKGDRQRRRFHVIDRAVQKARQEIMAQEDAAIFAALDAASGNNEE